jgi:hypothetical protein
MMEKFRMYCVSANYAPRHYMPPQKQSGEV